MYYDLTWLNYFSVFVKVCVLLLSKKNGNIIAECGGVFAN